MKPNLQTWTKGSTMLHPPARRDSSSLTLALYSPVSEILAVSTAGACLVAGWWGDISPDFAKLIQIFAESRAENMSRSQGWEAGHDLVGRLTGEIRRSLCVSIIRASQLCLLDRLSQLGPGASAAAARRQKTLQLEFRRGQEREAFHQVWLSRRSSCVGRAFI